MKTAVLNRLERLAKRHQPVDEVRVFMSTDQDGIYQELYADGGSFTGDQITEWSTGAPHRRAMIHRFVKPGDSSITTQQELRP